MLDFFTQVLNFIGSGIYDLLVQFVAYIISKLSEIMLYLTLKSMVFSWDIARQILVDLQVSNMISSMYSHFDTQVLNVLLWLKIPDFINNLITAYVTRFVMRFIPFL